MRPTPHTTLQNHFEIYFWLARNCLQGLFVLNTFCVLYPQTTVPFPQTSKMTHACLSSNTDTFPSFSKQNKIKQHTKKKQTSNNNKTKQKKKSSFCVFSRLRERSQSVKTNLRMVVGSSLCRPQDIKATPWITSLVFSSQWLQLFFPKMHQQHLSSFRTWDL